jgi:hypothetical protein
VNILSTIIVAAIFGPLLANLGSVFWQMIHERPFRVIYLPLSTRTIFALRFIGISILGALLFDRLVTHFVKSDVATLVYVLGFGLINILSVYYRWCYPLRSETMHP